MTERSPDEVRRVFSENLRILAAGQKSISRLCRDLGVNRTQFNRYYSGEAHPRPEVLQRICTYFGKDARILLEPLDEIESDSSMRPRRSLDFSAFVDRMREFDHVRVPDGYYRMIRPAAVAPTLAISSLVVLKRLPNGIKDVQAAIPVYYSEHVTPRERWNMRRLNGMSLQHAQGFSLLFASPSPGRLVQHCFFSGGFAAATHVYSGYSAFTHTANALQAQILPVLLEFVGASISDGMAVRRSRAEIPFNELRRVERDYFRTWDPCGPFDKSAV